MIICEKLWEGKRQASTENDHKYEHGMGFDIFLVSYLLCVA